MLSQIKDLLTPPTSENEDLSRIAFQLSAINWSAIIITIGLIPIFLLLSTPLPLLWVLIAMLLLELMVLYLMHLKKIKAACLVFTFGSWIIFLLSGFFQGGISSPLLIFLIAIVMVAALLMGPIYAIPLGIMTIIALTFMFILEIAQIQPSWIPPASLTQRWFILTVILFIGVFLAILIYRFLRTTMVRSHNYAQLLEDSNYELEKAQNELRIRVEQRALDLEERVKLMQSSLSISNSIASKRDMNILLDETVKLISELLGYNLVSIFLVDKTGKVLILRASNQEVGKELIAHGYTLEIGPTSIVGNAADTFSPCQSGDATRDPFHLELIKSPLSQITIEKIAISEIALPLISGDRLLGVLDIQVKNRDSIINFTGGEFSSSFNQDQTSILQNLAENIAIAIENVQLSSRKELTIEEVQRTYGSSISEALQKPIRSQPEIGYACCEEGDPVVVKGDWDPTMLMARNREEMVTVDQQTIILPIKIREQVSGAIKLRKTEEDSWSEDEIELLNTIKEHLSIALETAQLFDETRKRSERERLISQIATQLRSSNDPRIILQTAVRELRRALQADQAQILIQNPSFEINGLLNTESKLLESFIPKSTDYNHTRDILEENIINTSRTDQPGLNVLSSEGDIEEVT